jgi:hypothetical protein
MPICDLISVLNTSDLKSLNVSFDELNLKIKKIFTEKDADFDVAVSQISSARDSEFFWWFVFLKANFLRGSDVISNKVFKQFIDDCNVKKNNYYFEKFPSEGRLLPDFRNPKFRYGSAVEQVLNQVRQRYGSGRDFVRFIRKIVEKYRIGQEHLAYLELISELNSYKQIALKISNAIVGEVAYQLGRLQENRHQKFEEFTKEKWIKQLVSISCFNVMIDIHLMNFFKYHGIKNADYLALLLLSKDLKDEVLVLLFQRAYPWLPKKTREFILNDYRDFVGANMLEKLIWSAYFVKANLKGESYENLNLFKLCKETLA